MPNQKHIKDTACSSTRTIISINWILCITTKIENFSQKKTFHNLKRQRQNCVMFSFHNFTINRLNNIYYSRWRVWNLRRKKNKYVQKHGRCDMVLVLGDITMQPECETCLVFKIVGHLNNHSHLVYKTTGNSFIEILKC